jgi:two-component system response regulator YesN
MAYKVFFVEDEIVTREGIRDNVDWAGHGFEFCGEASDGELALPLLQAATPDVLITDIKMPFMDGLQLCKLIRERMPRVKLVILSGHDEFQYAQQAIKLGVTDYLLKPITVQDMHNVLHKIFGQLEQAEHEQEVLKDLQGQIEENRATLRERLLLKLVVGAVPATEVIEQAQLLGLDLVARCYSVVILKMELSDRSEQFDYDEYQQVQHIVSGLIENNPDVFLIKKDWAELVLVMKGNTPEYLEEERELLLDLIKRALRQTRYQFTIGRGTLQKRIADIYRSFIEALIGIQQTVESNTATGSNQVVAQTELLKVDKSAVENYLRGGNAEGFDDFFDTYLRPLGDTALKSYLIKNYLFVDVVLATAQLVNELGGDIDQVIPEFKSIETTLATVKTIEQLREQARKILTGALAFRDSQTCSHYTGMIRQAKDYIDCHYIDPELSLNQVAAQVNLSPSHFSVVFSQETRQTFKEYLTEIRIKRAKQLLRMTTLRAAEISYQIGYSDPHYFSSVFRKNTGLSPTSFRLQV